MEVRLSPDKEARLQRFAIRTGKDVSQVVEEAVDRMLESEACSTEAVEEGHAAGRRVQDVPVLADRSARGSVATYSIAAIAAVVMICLPLFFVASKHLASPDLWVDESAQVWISLGLHHFSPPLTPHGGWGDILRFGRAMHGDPEGFTVLLRFWMKVFGFSPLAIRSLPFLFFLLTPVVVILSALRCGANPIFAALAGSIPLGFPMMLHYATEVRPYSMEACAVAFLFFLPCWLTDERRDRRVILIGCVAALLVASRYSAFVFGAAACLTALLPVRPLRSAIARALRFGLPVAFSAAAAYLLFARYQLNGSHHAPAYVEAFLLSGKTAAAQLSLLRENLLGLNALPIAIFLVGAPLFFWLGPRSLIGLRSFVGRTAVFCALSLTFTALASLAGMLPWAMHTRWSIGYQSLSACCLATIVVAASICLCRMAADRPWRTVVIATAVCFAAAWSMQLEAAVNVERPYYQTLGSHFKVLAGSPDAKELRFFVQPAAMPTVRYLCELGPFKDAFGYPQHFHFETELEERVGTPISANQYDVIVLGYCYAAFANAYRARLADGKAELDASPQPSCLLIFKK
jgi:predicted transcriptional regulator